MTAVEIDTQRIWTALKSVLDPELGVNIVDLGLVYDVKIDHGHVDVRMTMTTPACPLSSYFQHVIPRVVSEQVEEVGSVSVRLVWDPPWRPEMMSDEAKKALGWWR